MYMIRQNEKGGWASLALAVVGVAVFMAPEISNRLGLDWSRDLLGGPTHLFFLAAEIVALTLGILMRKTGWPAKAGIVTSVALLFGSLLIL